MSAGLAQLNELPAGDAVAALLRCCGSRRWAEDVARRRPFADAAALEAAGTDAFARMEPADWAEAFAAHPRIGDDDDRVDLAATRDWSRAEQSGVAGASARTRARLRAANDAYVERFGHVFLVCATGRSAEEMLAELERRLANDAEHERREAAGQQRRITRLRLARLLDP